jgi:uncharacterized membrane protein
VDYRHRDSVLDALRTLAVLLMVAAHTTRLIAWDERRDWSRWVLLIEPFIASLFLYLVGASLAESWKRAGGDRAGWFRRQALRALPLWALSCLFYVLEEGFQFPDTLFLSGILATIAYTILAVMLLVAAPRSAWLLAAAAACLLALHVWLDRRGLRWFFLNAGNSPLLPLLVFALLGAWLSPLLRARPLMGALLAGAAMVTLVLLFSRYSFGAVFSKPLGRYETARVFFTGPPQARVEKSIPYYNLRPLLVPVVLSVILLLQTGLSLLRPALDRAGKALFPIGRHSLDAYILHLSVLALIVVSSGGARRPLAKAWQGDAVVLAAISACYAWSLGREYAGARRKKIRLHTPG